MPDAALAIPFLDFVPLQQGPIPLGGDGIGVQQLIILIIAAFAGGAFGAALGALPAFVFAGFMVIAGEAANVLKAGLAEGAIAGESLTVGFTGLLGFGPVFGPHISFAGGAAAAAYAAKHGKMESGMAYHNAKDIGYALGTEPDILIVGGLFGVFGMFFRRILQFAINTPMDNIAMTVFASALLHRAVLGYPVIGKVRGKGFFDMTPHERGEERSGGDPVPDGGDGTRPKVEPWLGHQYKWGHVAMIGFVAGTLGAYISLVTGSPFLPFGISAATLLFLALGTAQIPVTHHITLPGGTAALAVTASGDGVSGMIAAQPDVVGLIIGALFGILGAIMGEVIQRIFYAHGDTHVDPPAGAIVVCTLLIGILGLIGVFGSSSWVPQLNGILLS